MAKVARSKKAQSKCYVHSNPNEFRYDVWLFFPHYTEYKSTGSRNVGCAERYPDNAAHWDFARS